MCERHKFISSKIDTEYLFNVNRIIINSVLGNINCEIGSSNNKYHCIIYNEVIVVIVASIIKLITSI